MNHRARRRAGQDHGRAVRECSTPLGVMMGAETTGSGCVTGGLGAVVVELLRTITSSIHPLKLPSVRVAAPPLLDQLASRRWPA